MKCYKDLEAAIAFVAKRGEESELVKSARVRKEYSHKFQGDRKNLGPIMFLSSNQISEKSVIVVFMIEDYQMDRCVNF